MVPVRPLIPLTPGRVRVSVPQLEGDLLDKVGNVICATHLTRALLGRSRADCKSPFMGVLPGAHWWLR